MRRGRVGSGRRPIRGPVTLIGQAPGCDVRLNADGVQPDVLVEVPEGTPPERDLFLERAVDILTSRMLGTDA